ncbi:hypothetical protein [Streptomyces sp. WZ-12]|uniref:hypothetical protein n=1 Tax=Streptomyces sp. WZ-12 TaxID=3030210 RepID=UPI002380D855|nr:hypothetical protein [Streptomyces sp. WZ-12]
MELGADSVEAKLLYAFGGLDGLPFVVNRNTGEVRYVVPSDWERRLLRQMADEVRASSGVQEAA